MAKLCSLTNKLSKSCSPINNHLATTSNTLATAWQHAYNNHSEILSCGI